MPLNISAVGSVIYDNNTLLAKSPTMQQQQQPQNYYMHSENTFHNSQAYPISEHKPTNYHPNHHHSNHDTTECHSKGGHFNGTPCDLKGNHFNGTPCHSGAGQDQDIAHIVDQVLSCIDQFNVEQPPSENLTMMSSTDQIERFV